MAFTTSGQSLLLLHLNLSRADISLSKSELAELHNLAAYKHECNAKNLLLKKEIQV